MEIVLQPVAIVKNSRKDLSDDYWGSIISEIELLPHIPAEAFNGIETFSHVEIVYHFNKLDASKIIFHGHPVEIKNGPMWAYLPSVKKTGPMPLV
jgi:tRNA (adenine37-N6)-methyltransferase